MTHNILDHDTQKGICRSAVTPKKSSSPNHRLAPHGGEVSASSDICRSAVTPKKSSTPNHRLAPHGGEVSASSDPSEDNIYSGSPRGSQKGSPLEQKTPTVFTRSRDEENPFGSKPMPTFDPSDLIGRTFLLPLEENGERHRA